MPGEEDGRLAGGIAAADDNHLGAPGTASPRWGWRRSRRRALEALATLDAQPPVVGSGGDQQALGRDRLAALQVQDRVGVSKVRRDRRGDGQERAPNLLAWSTARSASSLPVMPVGKPR